MTALLETERGWSPLSSGVKMPDFEEILVCDDGDGAERQVDFSLEFDNVRKKNEMIKKIKTSTLKRCPTSSDVYSKYKVSREWDSCSSKS